MIVCRRVCGRTSKHTGKGERCAAHRRRFRKRHAGLTPRSFERAANGLDVGQTSAPPRTQQGGVEGFAERRGERCPRREFPEKSTCFRRQRAHEARRRRPCSRGCGWRRGAHGGERCVQECQRRRRRGREGRLNEQRVHEYARERSRVAPKDDGLVQRDAVRGRLRVQLERACPDARKRGRSSVVRRPQQADLDGDVSAKVESHGNAKRRRLVHLERLVRVLNAESPRAKARVVDRHGAPLADLRATAPHPATRRV